jgi:hypothetical protein
MDQQGTDFRAMGNGFDLLWQTVVSVAIEAKTLFRSLANLVAIPAK